MDICEALRIISVLADGVDPDTGEKYAPDSPYQNVSTVRALFKAKEALEAAIKKVNAHREPPERAGAPWSEEETRRLTEQYDSGVPIPELAKTHARTRWAIRARLIKSGRTVPELES